MEKIYELYKLDYIDLFWIKQKYKIWDIIFDEKIWSKEKIINIIPNMENFWFKVICEKIINEDKKWEDTLTTPEYIIL